MEPDTTDRGKSIEVEDLVRVPEEEALGIVGFVGGDTDDDDYMEPLEPSSLGGRDSSRHARGAEEEAWDDGRDEFMEDGEEYFRPHVPKDFAEVNVVGKMKTGLFPISNLEVVDRRFVPGDIVSRSADGDQQYAVVTNINIDLTVRKLQGDEMVGAPYKIDAKDLVFIGGLLEGSLVIKDSWLGKVQNFDEEVIVEFPNGALGEVNNAFEHIFPTKRDGTPEMQGYLFPGQTVTITPVGLQDMLWLHGSVSCDTGATHTATVKSLRIGQVNVSWVATNTREEVVDDVPVVPAGLCNGADLGMLGAYRHRWWRTGDRGILRKNSSGEATKDEKGAEESATTAPSQQEQEHDGDANAQPSGDTDAHVDQQTIRALYDVHKDQERAAGAIGRFLEARRSQREANKRRLSEARRGLDEVYRDGAPEVVEIISTETRVELLWQSGTKSHHVPAKELVPVRHLDPYVFFAGHFVKSIADSAGDGRREKAGVVHSMNYADRTAKVMWEKPDGKGYEETGQDVSVYDLSFNTDYDLHIGDVVLRLYREGEQMRDAWCGDVIGVGLGTVEIDWNDGTRSSETPDSLIVLYKDELDDDMEDEDEYVDDDSVGSGALSGDLTSMSEGNSAWSDDGNDEEMVDVNPDDAMSTSEPEMEQHAVADPGEEESHPPIAVRGELPQEALQEGALDPQLSPKQVDSRREIKNPLWKLISGKLISGIKASVASRIQGTSSGAEPAEMDSSEQTAKPGSASPAPENPPANRSAPEQVGPVPRDERSDAPHDQPVSQGKINYPAFQVLEGEPHGHHFASSVGNANSKLASTVRKEWQQLAANTPQGVYVHAYEARLDLLRVAIVGSEGTPYEDCLFFFDMQLPEDYPRKPPKAFFYSHGRRLNPNLYEDGKVCLSILGTWEGDEVETWKPQTSNVLRVLLSLQAMVLTDKPYFNEAGYEKQAGSVEGNNKSRLYNESATLLSLRHVISTSRPGGHPKEFSQLVTIHLESSRVQIISRCENFIRNDQHSVGFKRSLEDLMPRIRDLQ